MSGQLERVARALYMDFFPASGDWLKASAAVRELFLSQASIAAEALRPELEDAARIDAIQDIFIKGDEAHIVMCNGTADEEDCEHPTHPHFEAFAWNWRCDPVRGKTLRQVMDGAIDAARQEGK